MWLTILIVSLKETILKSYTKQMPGLDTRFAVFLLALYCSTTIYLNYF
jgi:hypothetical protein